LMDEDFRAAAIDTGWLERWMEEAVAPDAETLEDAAVLAAAFFEGFGGVSAPTSQKRDVGHPGPEAASKWKNVSRREGLRE
jgi:acetyl-CoA carboxylase biotin carboxylase subunit